MTFFTGIFAFGIIIILLHLLKNKNFGFGILSALYGFFALIAAYLISRLLNIDLPVTPFGITLCTVGGIPGVILLVALMTVFSHAV